MAGQITNPTILVRGAILRWFPTAQAIGGGGSRTRWWFVRSQRLHPSSVQLRGRGMMRRDRGDGEVGGGESHFSDIITAAAARD